MSRRLRAGLAVLAVVLIGLLPACAAGGNGGSGRPLVAVSTNILGDVVRAVVGDQADVLVLMPAGSDPHSFEISAQEAARVRQADLLVANGLGLEEGVQHHLDAAAADGVPQFVAGEAIEPIPYGTGDVAPAGPDDERGAPGLGPDPHLWTDPQRMVQVIDALEPALAQHVPALDTETLASSAAAYRQQLQELDTELGILFATIPPERRALVTNHNVFGYLAQRYGFSVVGTVLPGGSTLAAPSASDFDDLVADLEAAGVTTVFADAARPERLMQVLADEVDLDVQVVPLHTESLSPPGGDAATYLQMMRTNADRIAAGLTR
ncbi:metal ABC transporter substrate-binding protein [Nakamurella leprariae]|uniref:Zinc ABC transporter substrate-binding protein n=1 Tax=Nakamurella leprariae TaxID=2803911 RepID=A0A939C0U6_9ACTN|nr:metal ABC transporter substrate-binding protein [Nakamurella leprariae]MBM9466404.1 zinc ABC transporter substrate-binding protein [Nakamurella leprariae]